MVIFDVEVGLRMIGEPDPLVFPDPRMGFIPGTMPEGIKQLLAAGPLTSAHPATEEGATKALRAFLDGLASVGAETWDIRFIKLHLIDRLTGQWIATKDAWNFELLRGGSTCVQDVFLAGQRRRVSFDISLWKRTS